jgi:hypothetical protein
MTDTVRSQSDLLTALFQDGQTAGISAQDMRDLIVSFAQPYGGLYFSTPAATTVSASGTYYKAAGTTTTTNLRLVDDAGGTNNRLRYTGTIPLHFTVSAQVSLSFAAGTNQVAGLEIWHYDESGSAGALVASSQAKTFAAGTEINSLSAVCDLTLDTNDYIEIHIANHTGTENMQVDLGSLYIEGKLV